MDTTHCKIHNSTMDTSFYSSPGYTKTVPNEGMPITSDPSTKGNLIIEFDIEFPAQLTPDKKDMIRHALLH